MKIDDWPAACALGAVLLLLSLAAMAVTFSLVGSQPRRTPAGARRPMSRRLISFAATGYLVLAYAYLFAPVFALFLFSFQGGKVQGLPLEGVTLAWYRAAFESAAFQSGLGTSLLVCRSRVTALDRARVRERPSHVPAPAALPLLERGIREHTGLRAADPVGLVMLTYFQTDRARWDDLGHRGGARLLLFAVRFRRPVPGIPAAQSGTGAGGGQSRRDIVVGDLLDRAAANPRVRSLPLCC